MNDWAVGFLTSLFRSTLCLSLSAVVVLSFLKLFRVTSARWHRLACVAVMLQGCLLVQFPVVLPVGSMQWTSPIAALEFVPSPLEGERVRERGFEPREPLAPPPQQQRQAGQESRGREESQRSFAPETIPPEPVSVSPAEIPIAVGRRAIPWAWGLVWLWGAGIAVSLFRDVNKYRCFLRSLPVSQTIPAEWAAEWEILQRQAGVRTPAALFVVPQIGPLLCRHPRGYRLIVPAELWKSLTPEQRRPILQHELAHLLRGDIVKSLIVRLLALPQWFNPLVWRLARRFDECAEWACDEAVRTSGTDDITEYARTLLQLGESSALPLFAASAVVGGNGLAIRIRRLLVINPHKDSIMKKLVMVTLVLGLLSFQVIRFQLRAEEQPAQNGEPGPSINEVHASGSVNVRQNSNSSTVELTADRLVLFTDFKPAEETSSTDESPSENTVVIQGGATLTVDGAGTLVVDTVAKRTEAVVDIRRLITQVPAFQQDREKFKAEIAKREEKTKQFQQEMQALQEKYKDVVQKAGGDDEVVRAYQVIYKAKRSQFESERKAAQSELMWKETEMQLFMYEKVVAEVKAYAKEQGIRVVRRKNPEYQERALPEKSKYDEMKAKASSNTANGFISEKATPSQLLQKIMEKEIIYAEADQEFDITDEILMRLNAKFEAEKAKEQPRVQRK